MRRLLLVFCCVLAFSGFSFADEKNSSFDFSLGASWLGQVFPYPELDAGFKIHNWDLQIGLSGFGAPVIYSGEDVKKFSSHTEDSFSTASLNLAAKIDFGYTWKPWDFLGHYFGLGLTSFSHYWGDAGTYGEDFLQTFRLYFKYSYRFKSGWEIGAKSFITLFGFHKYKTTSTKDAWNDEFFIFYQSPGAFYELYAGWFTLLIPAFEFKYHF